LTFGQHEEIAIRRVQGQSLRQIGAAIGRSPSTISRELRRNRVAGVGYRATTAHALAFERASRPKPAKLHTNIELRVKSGRQYRGSARGWVFWVFGNVAPEVDVRLFVCHTDA
jgi:IS30 family transposase